MTTMQDPIQSWYLQPQQEGKHYIMGYIAARWPNFGAGKKAEQKRQMIAVWEIWRIFRLHCKKPLLMQKQEPGSCSRHLPRRNCAAGAKKYSHP